MHAWHALVQNVTGAASRGVEQPVKQNFCLKYSHAITWRQMRLRIEHHITSAWPACTVQDVLDRGKVVCSSGWACCVSTYPTAMLNPS